MSKRSYERRIQAKRDAAKVARKRAERMRKIRIWVSAATALGLALVLFFVFRGDGTKPAASPPSTSPTASPSAVATPCPGPTPSPPKSLTFPSPPKSTIDNNKVYVATFETSCGSFTIQMDPKTAPKTVNNFVFLARQGYYDGTFFHRVQNEADFAIVQGGDPKGDGTGGPGYSYDGETPAPTAKYLRGVIAMANSGGPNTNGSQFFVVVKDWPGLTENMPPNYTIFGNVIDETVSFVALDKMITAQGTPLQGGLGTTPAPPIYIIKITIEELARS